MSIDHAPSWSHLLFLLILVTAHGGLARGRRLQESDPPRHLNFFKSGLIGRQRVLSCGSDPKVCSDREKNPWGGVTCCFGVCKDTLRDSNNCGDCGKKCGFGFECCDGKCVDVQNDSSNCGSCFEECSSQGRCSFAMCDYG